MPQEQTLKTTLKQKTVATVIVAAGTGTRFGRDKLFIEVGRKTVIGRVLDKFVYLLEQEEINELVLVINPQNRSQFEQFIAGRQWQSRITLIDGGSERWESSLAGIKATHSDLVLIHDAARPFVKLVTIRAAIQALRTDQTAVLVAVPSINSVKLVDDHGFNTESLPRQNIWLAQTPQGFSRELILAAYQKALQQDFQQMTDESELITKFMDQSVKIVPGEESNLKITFVNDLPLADETARLEDLEILT